MPSAYRFTQDSVERVDARVDRGDRARQQPSVHHRLGAVQRIVGRARTCPTVRRSGTTSQALYHLTKTLDPTRPVIGNDGWESVATDIIGIHDYDDDPERIARRYQRSTRSAAAVPTRAPGRPPAGARGRAARGPADHADRVRRHRLHAATAGTWGYSQRAATARSSRSATSACCERCTRSAC